MNNFKYLKEVIVIFEKYIQEFGGQVVPCSTEEINILESMLSQTYRLPAAYKEFLLYGGKKMAGLFSIANFSYQNAKYWLEHRGEIFDIIYGEDSDAQLPPDMFVIEEYLGTSVAYFRLTEGEDPPVYRWDENGTLRGLEVAKKIQDSFSECIKHHIRLKGCHKMRQKISKMLKAKKSPRGQQFWIPRFTELKEGVTLQDLTGHYFGFYVVDDLEEAADNCGLSFESYLEELSGWKCRKVSEDDTEVRFFPPKT